MGSDLDIVELDRRAVELSLKIVNQVQPADLTRPTPCAGWTLRDLIEHMTAQHYGFAAAGRGQGADPRSWLQPSQQGPVAAYDGAAAHVLAVFAAPGTMQRSFVLPEISPTLRFPAEQAISLHFIDYVVHAWDVARSLGIPFDLDDDVADAGLVIALRVPDGPRRLVPGAAFRPSIPEAPDAPAVEQILAALGRSPAWPG